MALLKAFCIVGLEHKAGLLGWTLQYQDTNAIKLSVGATAINKSVARVSEPTVYTGTSEIRSQGKTTTTAIVRTSPALIGLDVLAQGNSSSEAYVTLGNPAAGRVLATANNTSTTRAEVGHVIIGSDVRAHSINTAIAYVYNRPVVPLLGNNSITVAKGNDLDAIGICYFNSPGRFPPGIYLLTVRRYDRTGLVAMKMAKKSWIIDEATEQLVCGGYSDPSSAIRLV